MKHKSSDKFLSIKVHDLNPVLILVIFPLEIHGITIKAQKPGIGDGNFVGVATQVTYHMPRGLKRLFAIDNPVFRVEIVMKIKKINPTAQFQSFIVEFDFPLIPADFIRRAYKSFWF